MEVEEHDHRQWAPHAARATVGTVTPMDAIPSATVDALTRGVGILFNEFLWGNIVPLLMFAGWVVGLWWMLASAQRNDETFRANEILRDEKGGKVSSKRFITVGTWVLHSMNMVLATINKATGLEQMLWFYGVLWSGTAVAMRAVELFAARPNQWSAQPKPDAQGERDAN